MNRCRETIATCERCNNQEHNKDNAQKLKSYATTAKQITKPSQGNDQQSKEKPKSLSAKQNKAYLDYRSYVSFSD